MPKTKQEKQSPSMGAIKIRMWSWLINLIHQGSLESWSWWFGISAIVLTLMGGVCGWIAFEMNDAVTKNKEAETRKRIEQAEAAARPKPLNERMIKCLNSIDARIIPALKAGQTRFSVEVKSFKLSELIELSKEPDGEKYISLHVGDAISMRSDGYIWKIANLEINPVLIQ